METVSELLRASLWTRSLTPQQMARTEAETQVRVLPVGVPVCRKGEAVEHWIGLIDGLVKMTSQTPRARPPPSSASPAADGSAKARSSRTSFASTTW